VNRAEVLDTANQLVTYDRAAEHGDARSNLTAIAGAWQAYLAGRSEVSAADVAAMMAILKVCRARAKPQSTENWIDGAGYLALGGELAPDAPTDDDDDDDDEVLRLCPAVLSQRGEHFRCDWPTDPDGRHDGWAHANGDAEVIWTDSSVRIPPPVEDHAGLRAQVLALPKITAPPIGSSYSGRTTVLLSDVITLLDGGVN
jgi:hypothetical protein